MVEIQFLTQNKRNKSCNLILKNKTATAELPLAVEERPMGRATILNIYLLPERI